MVYQGREMTYKTIRIEHFYTPEYDQWFSRNSFDYGIRILNPDPPRIAPPVFPAPTFETTVMCRAREEIFFWVRHTDERLRIVSWAVNAEIEGKEELAEKVWDLYFIKYNL